MQRIVINKCFGGFGLSDEALDLYKAKSGIGKNDEVYDRNIERDDSTLIEVIEELGPMAYGDCSELKIVEIPDGVEWTIEEYDGKEWISEVHRTWS